MFATVVPLAKDYKEAVLARKPVGLFKPRSAAAKVMVGARRRDPRRGSTRAAVAGEAA